MNKTNRVGSGNPSPGFQAISVIPKPTEERLTGRQLTDYKDHRIPFTKWVLNLGKNPERGKGYATETARVRTSRADQFYWV